VKTELKNVSYLAILLDFYKQYWVKLLLVNLSPLHVTIFKEAMPTKQGTTLNRSVECEKQ